jgi:hypothetical protein
MSVRVGARDPRLLQIAVLAGLFGYGVLRLDFGALLGRSVLIVAAALFTQLCLGRLVGLPRCDPRSALISALSLCLLLRAGSGAVAVLATVLAIGSKFALRVRGKHVFNPTNFGIVAAVFSTGLAWISPGQWGTSGYMGFLLACLGLIVIHRALRSDVTFAFLGAYAAILFARASWLGDPLAIPVHQLQSGSLLLFAFFMISDPKTTPDSRAGRLLFGVAIAALSAYMQFALYRPVAALPALFLLSPLVPLFDRIAPGPRYEWPRGEHPPFALKGADHASPVAARLAGRVHAALGPPGPGLLRLLRRQGG